MSGYPTDIVTFEGWGRIHEGHGLDPADLLADYRDNALSNVAAVTSEECWLDHQPRVKWCGNHGDACENEGDWHGHWHAMRPGSGAPFTIVHAAARGVVGATTGGTNE